MSDDNAPATEDLVLSGLPVGHDLLQVLDLNPRRLRTPVAAPLFMEFPVNPETGPFLVSSTRAVLWIPPETAARQGTVRAAVRPIADLGAFFREVLDAVVEMGREVKWGNVQPMTPEGLAAAVEHLRSYDLPEIEVLAHPETSWEGFETGRNEEGTLYLGPVPIETADWVTKGTAVVVPRDRAFVGFTLFVSNGKGVSVVHNACRSIAILTP